MVIKKFSCSKTFLCSAKILIAQKYRLQSKGWFEKGGYLKGAYYSTIEITHASNLFVETNKPLLNQ